MGNLVNEWFDSGAVTKSLRHNLFILAVVSTIWINFVYCQNLNDQSTTQTDFEDYRKFLRLLEVCPPKRCLQCEKSYGSKDISTFDCLGNCSLCQFCTRRYKNLIPECQYCTGGIYKCVLSCDHGKTFCLACQDICSIYNR